MTSPPPKKVGMQIKDERLVTFRWPLQPEDVLALARLIGECGNEGYRLAYIETYSGGNQRDPILERVELRFVKP